MQGDRIPTNILSVRILPNADPMLLRQLEVPQGHRSLGIFTSDCDDVSYAALDEATKAAQVTVVYARSMYAGAGNASTALAGEFIGILSGDNPDDVRSGLDRILRFARQDAGFCSANGDASVVYFAHCISRTGSYLSREAGVPEGTAMAYLIAPPLEAMVGLDAALKAADVELKKFYAPPSETNFAGGLLTGKQSACQAACEAFADMVQAVASAPLDYGEERASLPQLTRDFIREHNVAPETVKPDGGMSRTPIPVRGGKPSFVDAATGRTMDRKPEELTHLQGNLLVPKTHPRIEFRGRLDSLMAQTMEVQLTAQEEQPRIAGELEELMACLHKILGAEVKEVPLGEITLLGMDSAQLRYASHHIKETLGIDHPIPNYKMGRMCVSLNQLRTRIREAELSAARAFDSPSGCLRPDIIEGLNRLSSCVYILFCRQLSGYYNRGDHYDHL